MKTTIDSLRSKNNGELPRRDIPVASSMMENESLFFHYIPTAMMIANCLTKATSGRDSMWAIESGKLRQIDFTSENALKARSIDALIGFMERELDPKYTFDDMSLCEQPAWSSDNDKTNKLEGGRGKKEWTGKKRK